MKTKEYRWTTTYKVGDTKITHVFSDKTKVVIDFATDTTTTYSDGKAIDAFITDDTTITEYENFLIGIASVS